MRQTMLAVGVAFAIAGTGRAADPAPSAKTGLAVGTAAPAFALKDQAGTERTLKELLADDKKAALVFFRSASW